MKISQLDYSGIKGISGIKELAERDKAFSEAEKERLANVKTKNDFLHDSLMFANTPEKWNYTKDYLLKNGIIDKSAYEELGEHSPENWAKHFADLSSNQAQLKYHTDLLEGKTKEQAVASKDREMATSSLQAIAKLSSQVTPDNFHVLKPLIEKATGIGLGENFTKNAVPNLPDLNLETAEKKAKIAKELSDAGAGNKAAKAAAADFVNDQNPQNPQNADDGIIVEDLEPLPGVPARGNAAPTAEPEPQPVLIDEEPKINSKPDKLPPAELPYKPLFDGGKKDVNVSPLNGSARNVSFPTKEEFGIPLSRQQINAIQNADPRLKKDVLARAGLDEGEINFLNTVVNGDSELNGKNGQVSNPARRDFLKNTYMAATDSKNANGHLYKIKDDLMKDYTSGESANQIMGVRKTYETLSLLSEAAKDLAQGRTIPSNRVANYLNLQVGKDGQVDYNAYLNALAYDTNKALQRASPTDSKFVKDYALADKNFTPKQLQTAIDAISKVNGTQANVLLAKWNDTINRDIDEHDIDPSQRLRVHSKQSAADLARLEGLPLAPSVIEAIRDNVPIEEIKEALAEVAGKKR